MRRPSSAGKLDQLVGNDARSIRLRERVHPLGHPREATGVVEERARDLGNAAELRLRYADRAAAALEVACVQRLVIGGRERIRDEDRGQAGGGELPDRPT